MNATPSCVAIVLDGSVRIHHVTDELRISLKDSGRPITNDKFLYPSVKFDPSEADHFKNIDLISVMLLLNSLNVAFGEDFKQYCSPAAFLRELQQKGILKDSFKSIGFGFPKFGDFTVHENAA